MGKQKSPNSTLRSNSLSRAIYFQELFDFEISSIKKLFKYESIDETYYFPILGKPDACATLIRSSSTKRRLQWQHDLPNWLHRKLK
ncbi:hypothetical protein VCR1J2_590242 [Vibrio coralliirubri]|nr:hypothetical protein VCR1J2_590242 [Vibrio coralliirubri]